MDQPIRPWERAADLPAVLAAVDGGLADCRLDRPRIGVYSADPVLVPDAVLLRRPRAADVATMGRRGAAVPDPAAVEAAAAAGVAIRFGASRISADGVPVDAVVADLDSVVVECDSAVAAARGHAALLAAGACAHLLRSPGGRDLVAVTGGGVDVPAFLDRYRLAGRITTARLVTELRAGRLVSHLAVDDDAARALARHLHRDVRRALDGPPAVAA
jgi:hypothetical protein